MKKHYKSCLKIIFCTSLFISPAAHSIDIGPMVQAFGFPTIFRVGVEARIARFIGVNASYGIFPSAVLGGTTVKLNSTIVDAKIYPFLGSAFFGLGVGTQSITAFQSQSIGGETSDITAKITSGLFVPKIGWRWGSKFFFGMEVGWQIPVRVKTSVTHNLSAAIAESNDFKNAEQSIINTGNDVGKSSAPYIGLVQFGYFF